MKFPTEIIQAALRLQDTSAAGSDARLVADTLLAQHRPKRRAELTRDEDLHYHAQFMLQDDVPAMQVYDLLGRLHHLSPARVRRIVYEQSRLHSERVSIKIAQH